MNRLVLSLVAAILANINVSAQADDSAHAIVPPPVASVRRIDIVSSWGGLGRAQYEHTIIQRKGIEFVIDDESVQVDDVEALLVALLANPQRKPPPDLISRRLRQYDPDYYAQEGLQECVGDGAALRGVQTLFRRLFFDAQNQGKWLGDEYGSQTFHTDDYPAQTVTLTFEDGSTISASSQSQKSLMLPFSISRNGASYTTFDDRLPIAIAALTFGGVNSGRLDGGEALFDAYSSWLCQAFKNQIALAVFTAWTPQIARYIESEAIVSDDFSLSNDLSNVFGRVHFPKWPSTVTYQVAASGKPLDSASISAAALRRLHETKERGDLITTLPWVRRWFETAQNPRMFLETFVGGSNSLDWSMTMAQLKSESPNAYAAVKRNLHNVVQGMMWEDDRSASRWLFLPSGSAVDLDSGRGLVDPQGRTVNVRP